MGNIKIRSKGEKTLKFALVNKSLMVYDNIVPKIKNWQRADYAL